MTAAEIDAAHAQAQAVAMHAASYPPVPGDDSCPNCKHATGVTLLIAAVLMRCDQAPDRLEAIDHVIIALQRARQAVAAKLAQEDSLS